MVYNITILHERAPRFAQSWKSFQVLEIGKPVLVDVNTHAPEMTDALRFKILLDAQELANTCPVILYTGIPTSDHEAPCGCYGYDSVCEYHRSRDSQVADCFCCAEKSVLCSYHVQ